MKKLIFLLLLAAFILGGCANYRKIALEEVKLEKLKMVSTSKADVKLVIFLNNPTRGTLKVQDAEGTVFAGKGEFAKISLMEPVGFAKGEPSQAQATFRVELLDPLSIIMMGLNPAAWDLEQFTFSGYIKVKKGGAAKRFGVKDVPVKDFIGDLKF